MKIAAEKARAELKNATDAVKNEMARAKAEMDLSKKKLVTEYTNELTQIRAQVEEEQQELFKV
jgi:hypothetical protein